MSSTRHSVMGVGFVGGRYCQLYPHDTTPEPRDCLVPTEADVLFTRSTTSNYYPLHGDLKKDIETNLLHLMDVLPNVRGVLNWTGTWFSYGLNSSGSDPALPAREMDRCDPTGFYSATKLCSEHLIHSYVRTAQTGLVQGPRNYRILRLCSVIGNDPRADKEKGAIEMMLRRIKEGKDVDIYTGSAFRNVMHVDDVCRAIRLVMERGEVDTIYNIGNVASVRLYDLLHHALYITDSKSRINLVRAPRFHEIVQTESFHMCATKLRCLGFVPDMDAYEAVQRVIANIGSK